jgi:TolB-like protein
MQKVFRELKRRNVIRVALLYLVASWLILQVADVGISLLGLPVSTGRIVFLFLAIVFPLVLIFSWVFEITPEGVKRESEVAKSHSITATTGRRLDKAVVAVSIVAISVFAIDRFLPRDITGLEEGIAEQGITSPQGRSIAVLPFTNLSDTDGDDYFVDGLTDELLNLLVQIPDLKVAAKTSSFSFRGEGSDVVDIANKLRVTHVLEGSVRKSGDRLRISAQLVSADDGYRIWSQSWDRTLTDVFEIQDEIAAAVVSSLRITMATDVPTSRVTDPETYSLYLKAKASGGLNTRMGFEEATRLLVRALAIDPEYPAAWNELANVQMNQAGQKFLEPEEGFEQARRSAERSLSLDPGNGRALSALGWIAMYWDWDFPEATKLLREARRQSPGNASVLNALAVLVEKFGRPDEAEALFREAIEHDPVSIAPLTNLAALLINVNRVHEADVQIQAIERLSPDSDWVPILRGWVALRRGDAEVALAEFNKIKGPYGDWGMAFAHYDLGNHVESDSALDRTKHQSAPHPYQVASIYAYRAEIDAAFAWLDRAYDERDDWLPELRFFYAFESLHEDPRWDELVRRIGVSDADAEEIGL